MCLYPGKQGWIIVYTVNVENVAAEISKDYGRNVTVPQKAGWINVYIVHVENVAAEIRKECGRSVIVPRKAELDICLYNKCRERSYIDQ